MKRTSLRAPFALIPVLCFMAASAQGASWFVDENAPGDRGPGNPAVSDPELDEHQEKISFGGSYFSYPGHYYTQISLAASSYPHLSLKQWLFRHKASNMRHLMVGMVPITP